MKNLPLSSEFTLRRRLLIGLSGAALLTPLVGMAQTWRQLDAAVQSVGNAPLVEAGLQLTLPLVAEDGSSVPLTVSGDTMAGRIVRLEIFAPANPTPQVAVFEFGKDIGRLNLSTRIRLSESQTVVAVAHTEDGTALVAERAVRVTVSGCIAPAKSDPNAEMKARVRLPRKWEKDGGEVLTMISHPMITGLVEDETGRKPEARIVETFKASLNGAPVLTARYFRSLAANPYLKFDMSPTSAGDMHFEWIEDTGRKVELQETVKLG